MKKIFAILSIFIFCICGISPINSHANQPLGAPIACTITGQVLNKEDEDEPMYAGLMVKNTNNVGNVTDPEGSGNFEIKITQAKLEEICPKDTYQTKEITIEISALGYETKIENISCSKIIDNPRYDMGKIYLVYNAPIDELIVVEDLCNEDYLDQLKAISIRKNGNSCDITCDETMKKTYITDDIRSRLGLTNAIHIKHFCECKREKKGATDYGYDEANKYCYVTECDTTRYDLEEKSNEKENYCKEKACNIPNGEGKWAGREGAWECTVEECNRDYIHDPAATEYDKMCVPKDCKDTLTGDNKDQVTSAELVDVGTELKCEVKACRDGYQPNDDDTDCEANECTDADRTRLKAAGAKRVTFDQNKGKCIIKECECGYDPKDDDSCREWTEKESCETPRVIPLPNNAKSGTKACDGDKAYCDITECNENYLEEKNGTRNNKCVSIKGDPCSDEDIAKIEHAKKGEYRIDSNNQKYCHVTKCADNYEPSDDGKSCEQNECTPEDKAALPNARRTKYKEVNGAKTCVATECYCGYNLKENKCEKWVANEACDSSTEPKLPKNAEKGVKACTKETDHTKQKAYCDISECKPNYREDEEKKNTRNNKCVSTKGDSCMSEITDPLAEEAEYKIDKNNQRKCVITKCKTVTDENDNKQKKVYVPNDDGTACIQSKGECDIDQEKYPGGLEGKIKKGKCVPSKCKKGYELKKDKCIEKKILSKDDSEKQIAELEDNVKKLKENEQSKENRLLSGASMGATGIGGMQLASALSEQQADENAEEAMRAYLATFHCNYGDGKNIPGGTSNVELPGGNELINLYTEYVTLANDLKIRKTALDMRPGIESQAILDGATSGLYDDVSLGKTSGAFASLARALQDPNGPDAQAWAKQKSSTKSKLTTGAVIAGVGAVGGLVGDLIINKDAPKNQAKDIISKYEGKKLPAAELLADIFNDSPADDPNTSDCPDNATPNGETCECNDENMIYDAEKKQCNACPDGATKDGNTCKCKDDLVYNANNNKCDKCPDDAKKEGDTCKCNDPKTGFDSGHWRCHDCGENKILIDNICQSCPKHSKKEGNTCKCEKPGQEFNLTTGKCKCTDPNKIVDSSTGNCVDKPAAPAPGETATVILPASVLFENNNADLKSEGESKLTDWIQKITGTEEKKCKIEITGYADPTGSSSWNKTLSENRAKAAKDLLDRIIHDKGNQNKFDITAKGEGEKECNCGLVDDNDIEKLTAAEKKKCMDTDNKWDKDIQITSGSFAPCRRIKITINENCIPNPNYTAAE